MLYRLKEKLRYAQFKKRVGNLDASVCVQAVEGARSVAVSQVRHEDVFLYLLAITSLARHLPIKKIFVLNDGSLTESDISTLENHVDQVSIISIDEVRSERCPTGGTWERLAFIARLLEDEEFVLQVDADTLTLSPIQEVIDCVTNSCSFALGSPGHEECVSFVKASEMMKSIKNNHVQIVSEKTFSTLQNSSERNYVRGCSAFAGFAKDSFSLSQMEKFSEEMEYALGKQKWSEWGSEQVCSNVMLANAPRVRVLPLNAYANYHPELDISKMSFVHFRGTHRFFNNVYADAAKKIVASLGAKKSQRSLQSRSQS